MIKESAVLTVFFLIHYLSIAVYRHWLNEIANYTKYILFEQPNDLQSGVRG